MLSVEITSHNGRSPQLLFVDGWKVLQIAFVSSSACFPSKWWFLVAFQNNNNQVIHMGPKVIHWSKQDANVYGEKRSLSSQLQLPMESFPFLKVINLA